MSWLERWRRHRLENVEASIVDWRRELHSAERNGRGRGQRGVECRRVLKRLEVRRDRLIAKLGLEADEDDGSAIWEPVS